MADLVKGWLDADEAHAVNVQRGASAAELKASYLAALRAQLAVLEDEGDTGGARVMRAEIANEAAR